MYQDVKGICHHFGSRPLLDISVVTELVRKLVSVDTVSRFVTHKLIGSSAAVKEQKLVHNLVVFV